MPKPKIRYRKLGKDKPRHINCTCAASRATDFGRWKGDMYFKPIGGVITIDPRQSPKEQANTLLHELIHDALPLLDEYAVTCAADHIAEIMWQQGYRKVEKPQ